MNLNQLSLTNQRPAISHSRLSAFRACPRRYALQVHGSRSDNKLRIEKQMTGRALLVGSALHLAAAAMLRNLRDGLEPDEVRARLLSCELIRDTVVSSRRQMWERHPEMPAIDIHFEGKPEPDRFLEGMLAEVNQLIDELVCHVVFRRIRERALDHFDTGFAILAIDEMPREPVMIGLLPLWARFDLVVRFREDGRDICYVIDWKTGRNDKLDEWTQQASLYALAVTRLHSLAAEQVRVLHVNLQTGTLHETRFTEESLSTAAHELDTDDEDIRCLEQQYGRSNPMAWPALPHGSGACRWCAFQKRCGREDS